MYSKLGILSGCMLIQLDDGGRQNSGKSCENTNKSTNFFLHMHGLSCAMIVILGGT